MINWIIGIIVVLVLVMAVRHVMKKGTCDCGCSDNVDCKSCHIQDNTTKMK
ncbi:MAG: FeoB-associated Cys-rich membrane protein [Tissierellia bacterium]|nr:FeoB-associated Cys-rich membrane protein [Tissierellia bacterium]